MTDVHIYQRSPSGGLIPFVLFVIAVSFPHCPSIFQTFGHGPLRFSESSSRGSQCPSYIEMLGQRGRISTQGKLQGLSPVPSSICLPLQLKGCKLTGLPLYFEGATQLSTASHKQANGPVQRNCGPSTPKPLSPMPTSRQDCTLLLSERTVFPRRPHLLGELCVFRSLPGVPGIGHLVLSQCSQKVHTGQLFSQRRIISHLCPMCFFVDRCVDCCDFGPESTNMLQKGSCAERTEMFVRINIGTRW